MFICEEHGDIWNRDTGCPYCRERKPEQQLTELREALTRIRDCDWVITLPDRMDAVREIARAALLKQGGDG